MIQEEGRYDRQDLVWPHERLREATVLVVGAGAIGNEVVKGLVLLGVGRVVVVDMDIVAPSNLTRCVLFRDTDVGRRKSAVVARRARQLNPDCQVIGVHGDIEQVLSDSDYHDPDIVLGCLDNAYARYLLNMRMRRVGRPWIDAGIGKDAVQVTVVGPSGPCWACSIGERTMADLRERHSCTGFRRLPPRPEVPTTAVTAAVAAALQVQLAASHLSSPGRARKAGSLPLGRRWTLMLNGAQWLNDQLSQRASCPFHGRASRPPRQSYPPGSKSTFREMAVHLGLSARSTLVLDRELATGLRCSTCGRTAWLARPLARVHQQEAVCDTCGETRTPTTIRRVEWGDPVARQRMGHLGVVDGDWVTYRDGRSMGRVTVGRSPVLQQEAAQT